MTTIYLIRHSVRYKTKDIETYNTLGDKHNKDEKIILSVEGEERARLLSQKPEFDKVDVIYASDMVRTQATAKYLCERLNLPMHIDYRLNERKSGIRNDNEYPDWFCRQYLDENFKTVNGESQLDVRKRVLEVLNEILAKHKDKTVAIFTHGYAITFTLLAWCKLEKVNSDRTLTLKHKDKIIMDKIINAPEVFKLEFSNDKLVDIKLIEYPDLPFNLGI